MAAPSYTEDLTDIDLAESGSTGWTAFNISGGGGGAPAFGADFGMQGNGCWDKAASNAERGAAVNKTPGTGTVAAGVHIFQWGFVATPGVTDNLATRGAYVLIGTGTSDFMQFHVEGNDTYGAGGRVGKCYVVDYHTTANTGSVPYSTSNGTPGATPTYFGFGIKTTATVKGSNFGVDAVRYGTGAYITAGDGTTPATFDGFATQNDNVSNRWGILSGSGGSYELQGRFVIGQDNTKTPTAAHFDDSSGAFINIVDTPHAATDFTQIIIDHASTIFNLTGATFKSLGTINPGEIVINNASATSTGFNSCVFTDFGKVGGHTNIDYLNCNFSGCDQITAVGSLAGSSVSGYEGTADTSAVVWNETSNPSGNLDDMDFTMGTALTHAIEFGLSSNTTINLDNCTFTDYHASNGETSSALHFKRTSGTVTLNYSNMSLPSYKTDGATIDPVNTVTLKVTVTDQDGVAVASPRVSIRDQSDNSEISQGTGTAGGIYTDATYSYASDTPVYVRVRKSSTGTRYVPAVASATIGDTGLDVAVTLVEDSIA